MTTPLLQRETWVKEAFSKTWDQYQSLHDKGRLTPEEYQEWAQLATRVGRLDSGFYEMLPPGVKDSLFVLRPGMSKEAIQDIWAGAIEIPRLPKGLDLKMLKASEKAGIRITVKGWISSEAVVQDEDDQNSWHLQYDGPVTPDLKGYDHNANQYHDPKYQIHNTPLPMLRHFKKYDWTLSEYGELQTVREFEPGRFPGRRAISEWARSERVRETLSFHFIEYTVSVPGKGFKIVYPGHGNSDAWDNWVEEFFGGAKS